MKKTILIFALLLSVISVKAQTETDQSVNYEKKNEVKLNSLMLLLGAFEGSYERNINEESSFGISVLIPYDKDTFSDDFNYYVSPYYRVFFGKKYASGFFAEGFGMLNSYDQRTTTFINNGFDPVFTSNEETNVDFALGIGLGGKWVTKGGFLFELNAGVGRNLLSSGDDDYNFIGKIGLNVGYRF